jgi:hypothetical protein
MSEQFPHYEAGYSHQPQETRQSPEQYSPLETERPTPTDLANNFRDSRKHLNTIRANAALGMVATSGIVGFLYGYSHGSADQAVMGLMATTTSGGILLDRLVKGICNSLENRHAKMEAQPKEAEQAPVTMRDPLI